nr:hypothetical protein [Tanacetum cinerariifolium]
MGRCRDEIAFGTDAPYLGPERDRVVADLSQPEKDRPRVDIHATNILFQSLPRDIYKLINHNTDAKDIKDNVNMLLEGCKLTKDDRKSQLYDEFEHFRQHMGENIHEYYVRGNVAAGNEGAQNRADEGPVQDMAQNKDNIFQADQCDPNDIVDLDTEYTSNSNLISYE